MKLLLICVFIGISASSIAVNLFGDIELKDMSDQITALDWISLIEQMRNQQHQSHQSISDSLIKKFKRELNRGNNFIDFPQKAANFDFKILGIDLENYEREQLKKIMRTFVMYAAYEQTQKEVTRINQWKNTQPDACKELWSQLEDRIIPPVLNKKEIA